MSKKDKEYLSSLMERFQSMSQDDLLKEMLRIERGLASEQSKKKNNEKLNELKKYIKQEKEKMMDDDVKKSKLIIKQYNKDVKSHLEKELVEKSEMEKEYNEPIKVYKKELSIVMKVLREVNVK